MNRSLAQEAAEILKAVGHPVRLQIIELLAGGERCVGDIAEGLSAGQAVISQHLNTMRDKGILVRRRDGARVYYRIENENVVRLLDCIYHHCQRKKEHQGGSAAAQADTTQQGTKPTE